MAQQTRAFSTIFLTALAFLTLPLAAQAQPFYVNRATGSDANACASPAAACFTIQGAYTKCPRYGSCGIEVADGIYTEPVNVYYQHAVSITGNCTDPSRVVLQAVTATNLITAQDTVIAILGCMTLTSSVSGAIGIKSRQYAIVDYYNMRFGPFLAGVHIALAEKTKANCGGTIEIFGDAVVHASVADQSFLYMACAIAFTGQRAFTDVFQCIGLSLCRFNDFTYAGSVPTGRVLYIDQSRATGMNRLWAGVVTPDNFAVTLP